MAMEHYIVLYDDILAGLATAASFFVLTRFETDGIVTGIKVAVGDDGVGARLESRLPAMALSTEMVTPGVL